MKVVLELQDQPSNVRRITVRHDIVIGRGSDCNLRLSAPQVSRRHCFLRVGRDSVSVTDLDSSNGTFIDGTRITAGKRYDIANGDQLALGPIRFIIHVRSDVAVAETAKSGSASESKRSKAGRDTVAAYTTEDSSTINSQMPPVDAQPPMDYSVEQGGESAEPHEPTADYLDDQFSAKGSANLFSNAPDPGDSRLGIADFGKRPAEQSESNQETNDFPDADIVGRSSVAHEEPQWDSIVVDSSGSPENVEAANVADDVPSAWLSVDDDDTLLPEPMNLGNEYVGESLNEAFNDVDAEVIEEVEEIEEVIEVHEFDEVSETAEAAELAETNLEEIEKVLEVQDSMEIEDAVQAEETLHDAEAMEVQDWLNFDEVAEVQETLDVEEVVEVEDALDEVVIGETEEIRNVEEAAELQATNEIQEVAVTEEASADAEAMEVQDWLNCEYPAEVQEILDVEEVLEVEDALDEVVISETEDVLNAEDAVEIEPTVDDEELAEVEYFSDDAAVMEAEDVPEFDDVQQFQESVEINAAAAEPPTAEDALEIAVEEGGESNWFANDDVSESDAFFNNFISPELETDNTNSAKADEDDDDIDPDLQNFLKGF